MAEFESKHGVATESDKAEVEQLKKDEDVRLALEQTGGKEAAKKPVVESKQKFWLGTYILVLLGFGAAYYIFRLGYVDFAAVYVPLIERLLTAAMIIVLVLLTLKIVKVYAIQSLTSHAARFNLNRVANLLAGLAIFFIALSVPFGNITFPGSALSRSNIFFTSRVFTGPESLGSTR